MDGILKEAHSLVHGDRGENYGHPVDDFTRIGRMWAAILDMPDVTPEQVGLCMIALKLSREANLPKRDNRVDIAGYAETLDMIAQDFDETRFDDRDYVQDSDEFWEYLRNMVSPTHGSDLTDEELVKHLTWLPPVPPGSPEPGSASLSGARKLVEAVQSLSDDESEPSSRRCCGDSCSCVHEEVESEPEIQPEPHPVEW